MKFKLNLSSIFSQLLLLFFVILWITPTFGLLISSFRDKDQLAISGWWTSLVTTEVNEIHRTKGNKDQIEEEGIFFIRGNLFDKEEGKKVFNGLDMFIYQGQKSFYLWNKINPEIDNEIIELLNSKLR